MKPFLKTLVCRYSTDPLKNTPTPFFAIFTKQNPFFFPIFFFISTEKFTNNASLLANCQKFGSCNRTSTIFYGWGRGTGICLLLRSMQFVLWFVRRFSTAANPDPFCCLGTSCKCLCRPRNEW